LASIGFENGEPAGSAAALTWSAGQFVRLMLDVSAGKVLDRPDYTTDRYVKHTQGQTTLTVTAPADRTAVTGSTTVVGTTKPGNTVIVGASNQDDHTALTRRVKASNGTFSIPIPLTGGTTVLNIVAVAPNGDTARTVRTVVFDFAPGTLLFSADDPDGDDNGPGNYAYPTSSNFKAGAYDLERFEVYDAGDRIIFRVRTRDLTPTFGSPLGAQLVDLYINTGGSPVSNAAAFTSRNYTVAAGWTKRIEVQGFGQQYQDAATPPNTLGQVDVKGNDISRYITFSVTKASLGTPASNWRYTVVLTGQDGFSSDQARGFQPTPQEFQFGVCATASSDPHCTFDPGLVPKAIDVIGGQAQLDYTVGPVSIQPVQ
jgi:glucoamylase